MSLQFVTRWCSRIPSYERTMPIIRYKGVSYSPQQILEAVQAGSELGMALQNQVEGSKLGNTSQDPKLAQERLIKLLTERPVAISTYGMGELTSQELIEHIKRRDNIGKPLIQAELEEMETILALGKL